MPRRIISLSLSPEIIDTLDDLAASRHLSRSRLVELMVVYLQTGEDNPLAPDVLLPKLAGPPSSPPPTPEPKRAAKPVTGRPDPVSFRETLLSQQKKK